MKSTTIETRGRKVEYTNEHKKLQYAFKLYNETLLSLVHIADISSITRQTLYTKLKENNLFLSDRRGAVQTKQGKLMNKVVSDYYFSDLSIEQLAEENFLNKKEVKDILKRNYVLKDKDKETSS